MIQNKPQLPAALKKISLFLCAFLPLPLFAEETTLSPTSGSALFQVIFGLLCVILLLFGVVFVVRRFHFGKMLGMKGPLKVMGGLMLGTKERIVLIEVEDTWLVVGLVPGQIRTLHTLPKGTPQPETDKIPLPFSHWLSQFSKKNA